ncbi:glycosyltransferase family 2 protein [Radicibacter daui]|uniref:glycosyltransferase family 2 protein n=1 Tax=Radicibacter daui TaxID=3064829 RepID=UPI004046D361
MKGRGRRIKAPLPVAGSPGTGIVGPDIVVMTRNSAAVLEECLASVSGLGPVWVVDSASTDDTAGIAARHGAQLIPFRWNGQYPKKKQWCLENLPFIGRWVLFLDSDERLTPGISQAIRDVLAAPLPGVAAYYLRAEPVFVGQRLRHGRQHEKIALMDRTRAFFPPCGDIAAEVGWEVEGHYQPQLEGQTGRLKGRLAHIVGPDLSSAFARHNGYSDWAAAASVGRQMPALRQGEPWRRRFAKAVLERSGCAPLLAFADSYLLRLGFLDGAAGLHYALFRGFYYWQIALKRRERALASTEPAGAGAVRREQPVNSTGC